MNTLEYNKYGVMELTEDELMNITGGAIPWGLIGRVALRGVATAAGIGTGVGIVVGVGLLAYEIFS